MAEKSISEMEKNAAAVASQALAEPLKTAVDVLNLATKVQANDVPAEKLTKAGRVKLLLLQRIQNDLRCCMILDAQMVRNAHFRWPALFSCSLPRPGTKQLSAIRQTSRPSMYQSSAPRR
jgi:hypothetical protein